MSNITAVDVLSMQLPTNESRLYVRCMAGKCEVYYPVKNITEDEDKQSQYMLELRDFYQKVLDEV